jgi:uncharacterized protein (TIGR03435 family)
MSRFAALLLCLAFATPILAQQPQAPPRAVAFDVVSVKKSAANSGIERLNSGITQRPDGGISMLNVPVGVMIGRAYSVRPIDVQGLPGWALSINDRYDLVATASVADATAAERAAMLQAALADRFKLAVHFEKREQPTHDLVVARRDGRPGPGLTPIDTDCDAAERAAAVAAAGPTPAPPRQLPDFKAPPPPCTFRVVQASMRDRLGDGQGALGDLMEGEGTMTMLARVLLVWTGRPVIDKTDLTGAYRVKMNFDSAGMRRPPEVVAPENAGPSVFSAVQEQLGLKLESSKTLTETLVIDRLERPTEN